MPKIKILHIVPIFATGGAERLVLQYAKSFSRDKFEIYVASCVETGELQSEFEKVAKGVFVGSRQELGSRRAVYRMLEKYVEQIKPDIIHTHMLSADYFGFSLKRKYGSKIKWVSTMHNVETATSYPRQILWRFILRRADRVISVCQKVENFTLKEFKINKQKSQVILNGIDLALWLKIPTKFIGNELQLACVGRFWTQKGHKYLFQALALLKNIPWHLHLFGDGPLKNDLLKQAEELKINQNITWHGVSAQVAEELVNIDVVVQPSLWEGLSLVVMEAMAAGKLVVATTPAAEELVKDNFTGLVIPPKEPQKLAETISWIFNNKKEGEELAIAGREYALQHFSIEKNIGELIQVYENV